MNSMYASPKAKAVDKKTVAYAYGKELPISFKQAIEITRYVRGKPVQKAKQMLERVLAKQDAVPFRRFNDGVGHKPGIGVPGRYPQKATQHILAIIKSAESNAIYKGLNVKNLIIVHIAAQDAPDSWHYGRQTRRKFKRCHVEVVVQEVVPSVVESTEKTKKEKKEKTTKE